jgi:hypothetical protein
MGIIEKVVVTDETMRALEADARRNGRTVAQEAAERLNAEGVRPSRGEILARIDAVAAMTPKAVKQTDSTILIREDRDR